MFVNRSRSTSLARIVSAVLAAAALAPVLAKAQDETTPAAGGLEEVLVTATRAGVTAFNAAAFAMRGVGLTDIIVYQDAPVSVQVDDFVMPSVQTQLLDTFD